MARDVTEDINNINSQLNALDSRMRVVAQRMKIIEKNEQIIGKTLISHNKKMKEIEKGASPSESVDLSELHAISDEVKRAQVVVNDIVKELKEEVIRNKETMDKMREEINEMKYILENINPIEYVTVKQVSDLIDEKIGRK